MAIFVLKILMLRATMIVIALSVMVSYVVLLTRGWDNRSKPTCRYRVRLSDSDHPDGQPPRTKARLLSTDDS